MAEDVPPMNPGGVIVRCWIHGIMAGQAAQSKRAELSGRAAKLSRGPHHHADMGVTGSITSSMYS
jgi:hypothetical protein